MLDWLLKLTSWTACQLAKMAKIAAANLEEICLAYRQKRGWDVSNFESGLTEAQYMRLATILKTRKIEAMRGEVGESVVLRPENFPELSRRQARKVCEYWRLIEKVSNQ